MIDDQQLRRILVGDGPSLVPKRQKLSTTRRTKSHHTREQMEETTSRLAYELYQLRGAENGRDFDEWLAAEAEITAGK
jgi:hypothetical protein